MCRTSRGCTSCAIASTGSLRAPQLPDVPTVAELGYPGFSGEGWGGIVATKGVPPEIVARISGDLHKVMSDPDTFLET